MINFALIGDELFLDGTKVATVDPEIGGMVKTWTRQAFREIEERFCVSGHMVVFDDDLR